MVVDVVGDVVGDGDGDVALVEGRHLATDEHRGATLFAQEANFMLGGNDDSSDLRRDFQRTLVRTELLSIGVRMADGRVFGARSRDISLSGIYVATDEHVEARSQLQLVIGSLSGSAALQIAAEVVYADGASGFGARYVMPSEEAHGFLAALIQRLRDPAFGADPPHTLADLIDKHGL